MRDDYTTTSHYLTYTFLFEKLEECTFWTWEWKRDNSNSLNVSPNRATQVQRRPPLFSLRLVGNKAPGKAQTSRATNLQTEGQVSGRTAGSFLGFRVFIESSLELNKSRRALSKINEGGHVQSRAEQQERRMDRLRSSFYCRPLEKSARCQFRSAGFGSRYGCQFVAVRNGREETSRAFSGHLLGEDER